MDLFSNIDIRNDDHPEGLKYIPKFLSNEECIRLLTCIDKEHWLTDLNRRVQHYGYKYDYKRRKIDNSMRMGSFPEWLHEFTELLKEKALLNFMPDQVIVNEYLPGQGISNHIDCEPCFNDTIVSISLGSSCVMNFTSKNDKNKTLGILLEPGSLVMLQGAARYEWMHGIKGVKTDKYLNQKVIRKRRVSLTFRKVILT